MLGGRRRLGCLVLTALGAFAPACGSRTELLGGALEADDPGEGARGGSSPVMTTPEVPQPPPPGVDLTQCSATPSPYYVCLMNYECTNGPSFQTSCTPGATVDDGLKQYLSCLCLNLSSGTLNSNKEFVDRGQVVQTGPDGRTDEACKLATSLCQP
jgi:hypothetical protein